ncbi:S26 family signal peptidase [Novosphingobium sp. 17-62-19]|uniref:S26 family signal peptidase n=1 Tax=Novosphingobium sp. 17-62-19 TaxID=1970406 RepID=UPI0025DE60B6|nr:S26 family signal peptidase [Novosphingobium sp. 17-62-19]HQS96170.1 S26 family signal peptidase [Novosphingobium sp.]
MARPADNQAQTARGRLATQPVGVRHLTALFMLAAGSAAIAAVRDWHDRHVLLINVSQSLPDWAFLLERARFPARGDYVVFAPGKAPLVRRHFGKRPAPFVKITYGLPGDLVSRTGSAVIVNGRPVARLKPRTRQGEILQPGPLGLVPAGCVFAGSPHKDGFDSRYAEIGFICRDRLIGTAEGIL